MRSLAPLAAAILIGTTAFVANAGVVEDRKANFKANNASMRVIGAAIGGGGLRNCLGMVTDCQPPISSRIASRARRLN